MILVFSNSICSYSKKISEYKQVIMVVNREIIIT